MIGKPKELVPEKRILRTILVVRGEKVILDSDLAELYGVETRRLNEQVRRNVEKFPKDFMFQLTEGEFEILKSQFATSSSGWCVALAQVSLGETPRVGKWSPWMKFLRWALSGARSRGRQMPNLRSRE